MEPMHEAEDDSCTICADCGQEMWLERERGYLMADERTLCFACAVARGGQYDEHRDHWLRSPELEGFSLEHEHLGKGLPEH